MANSQEVSQGDLVLASQFNNLRKDILDTSTGHTHTGDTDGGRSLLGSVYINNYQFGYVYQAPYDLIIMISGKSQAANSRAYATIYAGLNSNLTEDDVIAAGYGERNTANNVFAGCTGLVPKGYYFRMNIWYYELWTFKNVVIYIGG